MKLRRTHCTAGIFGAALLLYLPALSNGFAYDDVAIIQGDPRVHSLTRIGEIMTRGYWADAELALYRPLTTLSFAVDWTLAGGGATWFLFMNAMWNATVAALVFLLLARITSTLPALLAALLFAAHPVHVEAVANVVGRAELIAATFMLSAMLVWMRIPDRRRVAGPAAALLFGLALLTKESAIMLPALLILVDMARGDLVRTNIEQWLRARAMPLALLGVVAVAYVVMRTVVLGSVTPARLDAALEVTAGTGRILTALQAWPHYARLLLAPVTLLADYGPRIVMPATGLAPAGLAGGLISLALVFGGVLAWWRGHGRAAMCLLWFPVAILPVSNLVMPIGIILAERTLYLPSFALVSGVAVAFDSVHAARTVRMTAAGAALLIIALFAVRTVVRIPDWRSTDTLFAALLRDCPDSFRAHWHHARLDAVAGRHANALQRYVRALELWPHRQRLVIETIHAAIRARDVDYARQLAGYAERKWPANVDAARLHAAITLDLGDTTAARSLITDARRRFPSDSMLMRMNKAMR